MISNSFCRSRSDLCGAPEAQIVPGFKCYGCTIFGECNDVAFHLGFPTLSLANPGKPGIPNSLRIQQTFH